jgi:hypothetical protein
MSLTTLKAKIVAHWQHLITKEKALLKSATIYLSVVLAAAPNVLEYMQTNFPSLVPYLPHVLADKSMKWIALAVIVCRMRSLVKLPTVPSS